MCPSRAYLDLGRLGNILHEMALIPHHALAIPAGRKPPGTELAAQRAIALLRRQWFGLRESQLEPVGAAVAVAGVDVGGHDHTAHGCRSAIKTGFRPMNTECHACIAIAIMGVEICWLTFQGQPHLVASHCTFTMYEVTLLVELCKHNIVGGLGTKSQTSMM
jgi:hypothetical protein